jgi:hypothetical protein
MFNKPLYAINTIYCNIITELTSNPNLYPWCSTSLQRDNNALFSMSSTSLMSRTSQVSSAFFRVAVMAPRNANVSSYRNKLQDIFAVFHTTHSCNSLKYKVVQIWLGQTVTCLHTNRPGHIWTTLYYEKFSLAHTDAYTYTYSTDSEFSQWQQHVK